jgi:hypothetical protein
MLASLLLAGALGTGIITLSSGANAKSADNGSVTFTGIERTGSGHATARVDGVRLAWGVDKNHHKHRSHHHHDDD